MSSWGEVFLGVIAFSTLVTSVILIALLVAIGRLARRLEQLVERFERELAPVFGHLQSIAGDAARAASLATAQVERVDRLFADLAASVDDTIGAVQTFISSPLRKGGPFSAAMSAFWAVVSAVRDGRRGGSRSKSDDEDALFI